MKRKKGILVIMAIVGALAGFAPITVRAETVSGGDAGKQTEQQIIYQQPAVVVPQPMAQISSKGAEGKLSAGQEFLTEITIKNKGTVTMERPVVTVAPSEQVLAVDNTNSSYEVKDIEPGKSQAITLRWKMGEKLSGNNNEIGITVKFYYNNGSGLSQGTDSGKILLSTDGAANVIEGSAPNLIISGFSYGGEPIAAGEDLDLSVILLNTSKVKKIENLVVSADNGEGLSLRDTSNTFYFESLKPGKETTLTLPLKVSAMDKNTSAAVTFQMKYEYVDNEKRSTVSTSQVVAVPVYQKDCFTVLETILPQEPVAGEEQTVSVKYVNEGRGEVSNVKAELLGSDEEGGKVQYLGNFEAGKTGSINFIVTPAQAGKISYTVKITYEDANLEPKEQEVPVEFEVAEPVADTDITDMNTEVEAPQNDRMIKTAAIGGVGILLIVTTAGTLIKGKRRKERAEKFENLMFDNKDMEE